MKIKEIETGRIFIQDGDWKTFNRDWNHDGDMYTMTVGFFDAEQPFRNVNRIELCPLDIGPFGEFIEINEIEATIKSKLEVL